MVHCKTIDLEGKLSRFALKPQKKKKKKLLPSKTFPVYGMRKKTQMSGSIHKNIETKYKNCGSAITLMLYIPLQMILDKWQQWLPWRT